VCDLIADDFGQGVDAKVAALDGEFCDKPTTRLSQWAFANANHCNWHLYSALDTMHRHQSGDDVVFSCFVKSHFRTSETDLRKFLNIKKLRSAQMVVTQSAVCINTGNIDLKTKIGVV